MKSKVQIKAEMTDPFMANPRLSSVYGFILGSNFDKTFSKVSVENILFEIIAYTIFLLMQIFDQHKKEVDEIIFQERPHTERWYRQMALAFQYGFDLLTDSDKFDNGSATDDEISESKIIKYAAVTEATGEGRLIIKIATEVDGVLSPISPDEYESFSFYIKEVRDAGVKYLVVNAEPDLLFLDLKIYRNPLVLDESGMSIRNGNFPVKEALLEYMKELPFNGELVLSHLIDKLQTVEGVKIPQIDNAETKVFDAESNSYNAPENLYVKTIPVSGYFKIETIEQITYVV